MKILQLVITALLIMNSNMILMAQTNLNLQEKDDMLFLLEEEKLARDVYVAMEEKWDHMAFKNISEAEQRHLDMVCELAKENQILVPEVVELDLKGKFDNKDLQKLYDDLVVKGERGLVGALAIGAWIEERDITDLDHAMLETDKEELTELYSYLRDASENHLRAFNRNLETQGIDYEPQLLTVEEFDDIISGTNKSKGKCKSKASSSCCKKGKKKGKGKACCKKASS